MNFFANNKQQFSALVTYVQGSNSLLGQKVTSQANYPRKMENKQRQEEEGGEGFP